MEGYFSLAPSTTPNRESRRVSDFLAGGKDHPAIQLYYTEVREKLPTHARKWSENPEKRPKLNAKTLFIKLRSFDRPREYLEGSEAYRHLPPEQKDALSRFAKRINEDVDEMLSLYVTSLPASSSSTTPRPSTSSTSSLGLSPPSKQQHQSTQADDSLHFPMSAAPFPNSSSYHDGPFYASPTSPHTWGTATPGPGSTPYPSYAEARYFDAVNDFVHRKSTPFGLSGSDVGSHRSSEAGPSNFGLDLASYYPSSSQFNPLPNDRSLSGTASSSAAGTSRLPAWNPQLRYGNYGKNVMDSDYTASSGSGFEAGPGTDTYSAGYASPQPPSPNSGGMVQSNNHHWYARSRDRNDQFGRWGFDDQEQRYRREGN